MLRFMEEVDNIKPNLITYNALLSGMMNDESIGGVRSGRTTFCGRKISRNGSFRTGIKNRNSDGTCDISKYYDDFDYNFQEDDEMNDDETVLEDGKQTLSKKSFSFSGRIRYDEDENNGGLEYWEACDDDNNDDYYYKDNSNNNNDRTTSSTTSTSSKNNYNGNNNMDGSNSGGSNNANSDEYVDTGYWAARHKERAENSVAVLAHMIRAGIRPNSLTASSIVRMYGRCLPTPLLNEATAIIQKLTNVGYLEVGDLRVNTEIIIALGNAASSNHDDAANILTKATKIFRGIRGPDTVAMNAFLDTCCRCGAVGSALDVFSGLTNEVPMTTTATNTTAASSSSSMSATIIEPNIVTYSVLITSLLSIGSAASAEKARELYTDMKVSWGIKPDRGLVDG